MGQPTKNLSKEHEYILKAIKLLVKKCGNLEGEDIDNDFFNGICDFIKNYADGFHHAKEEDILFPELRKDDVKMHCDPTEQMLYEHDLGRKFVKGILDGVKEGDKGKIIENSRNYAELLEEHIYKEDNILYPMADEALSAAKQKKLLDKFMEAEKKFGEGFEKKYINLIKNL